MRHEIQYGNLLLWLALFTSEIHAQSPEASIAPPPHAAGEAPVHVEQSVHTNRLMETASPQRLNVALCISQCGSAGEPLEFGRTADIVKSVAWPGAALLIALILIFNARRLRQALGPLRRVKAGTLEFEFSSEDALRVKESITESYEEFQKTAKRAYAHYARAHLIQEHFDQALHAVRTHFTENIGRDNTRTWPDDSRATLHINDIVVSEFTYQLLDYVPRGGGSGRRFSSRRGILGRALRLDRSIGVGDALRPLPAIAGGEPSDSEETRLIESWGMSRHEAASWKQEKRHSFLCIIVREPSDVATSGVPLGVLYIDSTAKNSFGTDNEAEAIAKWAERSPSVNALGVALAKALADLREGGTFLEF